MDINKPAIDCHPAILPTANKTIKPVTQPKSGLRCKVTADTNSNTSAFHLDSAKNDSQMRQTLNINGINYTPICRNKLEMQHTSVTAVGCVVNFVENNAK